MESSWDLLLIRPMVRLWGKRRAKSNLFVILHLQGFLALQKFLAEERKKRNRSLLLKRKQMFKT